MESKIKKEEASIELTPQGNLETPGAADDPSDAISDQIITDMLNILEDLTSKKPLRNAEDLSEALNLLFVYEEEMLEYIEKKSNLDSVKKETLCEFTYDVLSQLLDNYTFFNISYIKQTIRSCFDSLLKRIYKDKTGLKKSFEFLSDIKLNEYERVSAIESQISALHEKFYLEFFEDCYSKLQANLIPHYLLKGYSEKLNVFLLDNVSKECLHEYYEQFKAEQPEVKQMNFFLKNLLKRDLALFDKRPNLYLTENLIETLFKILVISNLDYFDKDPIANRVFISKMKKYAIIMNFKFTDAKNFYEFYKSLFISLKNISNHNKNKSSKKTKSTDKNKLNNNNVNNNQIIVNDNENDFEVSEFSFDGELKSLFAEVRSGVKSPEIYYFIIFSFSLMLNEFVLVDFGEVVINPVITVNARERQFLLNLLKRFNKHFDDSKLQYINHKSFPFYLNSIVESFIAKSLIKDENIEIFGLGLDNKKIDIDHKIIIDSILEFNEDSIDSSNNYYGSDNNKKFFGTEKKNLNIKQKSRSEVIRRPLLSNAEKQVKLNNEMNFKYSESNLESGFPNQLTLNEDSEKELEQHQNTNSIMDTNKNFQNNDNHIDLKNGYSNKNNQIDLLEENQINFEIDCDHSEAEIALSLRIAKKYKDLKPNLLESSSTLNSVFSALNNFLSIGFGVGIGDKVADAKLELEKIKISPLNNYIFSVNTSIFFSGFLSEGSDYYDAWKFFKFSLDENKEMHSFQWPALSYNEIGNQATQVIAKAWRIYLNFYNKNFPGLFNELVNIKQLQDTNIFHKAVKIAKLSGKILAFAIAKRKIFRAHSINLIGFSLGCQVIKSFLKELFELAQNEKNDELNEDLINIVQNVVFIGGAVDLKKKRKWRQIFNTLVAGKIINIHCDSDLILKKLYKFVKPENEPIGIRKLVIDECSKIENYDVTDKNDGHLSYRGMLDHIMMDVDLDL